MGQQLSESRFNMWRGVVAMAHADGVVSPHELSFINDYVQSNNFSQEQLGIIGQDLRNPQDVYDLFNQIVQAQDKRDFFALARALSWCDGDYDAQEKMIINHLEKANGLAENKELLKESREICNEVELCGNQWKFKTERSKNLFGFLDVFKAKPA